MDRECLGSFVYRFAEYVYGFLAAEHEVDLRGIARQFSRMHLLARFRKESLICRCAMILPLLVSACDTSGPPAAHGRLEHSRRALDRLRIGNDTRYVLPDLVRTFSLKLPAGAVLRVGFGLSVPASLPIKELELQVTWTRRTGKRVLWSNRLVPAKDQVPTGWNDIELPLAAFAGQTGKLGLEAKITRRRETEYDGLLGWTVPWIWSPRSHERTNVLLISVDTLRPDRLHCYGYARETSPHIDRLAQEGVLFREAIAPSSWTLPSHASLFTGLNPSCHGAVEFGLSTPLSKHLATLAELLWDQGYATAGFTGGGFVSALLGFDQGFDRFLENQEAELKDQRLFRAHAELAIEWMKRHRDRPFFLFLHTYRTHMPYAPPAPYHSMFAPMLTRGDGREFSLADYRPFQATDNVPPVMLRRIEALYDGEIRYMDEVLGEVFDFLDASGLAENTCVAFTSDHGEEFKEHGNLFHHHAKLYDELIRVPLILRCPSTFEGGRVIGEPVGLIDVMPTLLEIAGAAVPRRVQGQSLYDTLRTGSFPPPRPIVSEVDGSVQHTEGSVASLRTKDAKLIIAEPAGSAKLFNLQADPGERIDLSRKRPDFVKEARAELKQMLESCPHPIPSPPATAPMDPAIRERLRALGYDQ